MRVERKVIPKLLGIPTHNDWNQTLQRVIRLRAACCPGNDRQLGQSRVFVRIQSKHPDRVLLRLSPTISRSQHTKLVAKSSKKFLIFCFWIVSHFDVTNHMPIITSPIMHFCPRIMSIEAVAVPIKRTVDTVCVHNTILTIAHIPFDMGKRGKILRTKTEGTALVLYLINQ